VPAGALKVFVSNVTAPVRAKALPFRVAPVVSVMDDWASMLPANTVVVPKVAELPSCQKTLPACALLISTMDEPLAVVSVLPIWKMNSAF
jgi:hypothetical protein